MSKNDKKVLVWGIVILVVIIGIVVLSKDTTSPTSNNKQTASPTPSGSASTNKTTPKKTTTPNLDYSQMIQLYEGKRVQFNDFCTATPSQMVVKKGTKVMLDNRSKISKTLKLDTGTITLPGYGWQIITATTNNSLPYNFSVDCKSTNGNTENGLILNIQANISNQVQ